ncbi:MAG: hypothetical protein K9H64_18270 [Bacteroidales bacterium]|nr:hypothetical protein [Bacteroidales bacterium]MCF8457982.1 hypothetical protein [Bacteroidales bacterium]
MTLHKSASIAIFLIILMAGCLQHPANPDYCKCCPKCEDFPSGNSTSISRSQFQYMQPCYNPNNSNEFVFHYRDYETNTFQLVKYNIKTNEKEILINDFYTIFQPKWGENNWILCTDLNNSIWKIKSNGDSLSSVAYVGANYDPDWDCSNTHIIYTYSLNGANKHSVVLKDYKTNSVDTISRRSAPTLSISNTNILAIDAWCNISLANLSDSLVWTQITNVDCTENYDDGKSRIVSLFWHPNSKDIYYCRIFDGIYTINIDDLIEKRIKNACDTRHYLTVSVSPDGDKLLVERIHGYWADYKIYHDSKIYIMDIDGCNEKEVVIDMGE